VEQTTSQRTADTIRAELARRKIAGRELGRAVGWSAAKTWRHLNGETPLTVDHVAAVAAFLGIPVTDLIPHDRDEPAA
jgi:hypothetical protein